MVTQTKGKTIPGFSQGVRENSAIRMKKMVQPICPHSQTKYDTTPEGKLVPRRDAGQQPNCQIRGGQWWKECETLGHDPYNRTRIWYSKEDQFDTDSTGEQVQTGVRTVRHEDKIPNIAQVAAHIRVNSARGPELKKQNAGFRDLVEMGFDPVCEMRNCQKPVEFTSNYGEYCSRNHAALCAADGLGKYVTQIPGLFDQGMEVDVRMKRREQLRVAAEAAGVRRIA